MREKTCMYIYRYIIIMHIYEFPHIIVYEKPCPSVKRSCDEFVVLGSILWHVRRKNNWEAGGICGIQLVAILNTMLSLFQLCRLSINYYYYFFLNNHYCVCACDCFRVGFDHFFI